MNILRKDIQLSYSRYCTLNTYEKIAMIVEYMSNHRGYACFGFEVHDNIHRE